MNKGKLLELSDTLRGIAEESNVASFEQWHEDGWVNCKFRYRHETQPDPCAEFKAARAAGKTIQCKQLSRGDWLDTPNPTWSAPASSYRIKPEPQKLPLSQDDVKAGDEFLVGSYRQAWLSIKDGLVTYGSCGMYSFKEMMQFGHKIRSIGETEWRPCYKLVEQ